MTGTSSCMRRLGSADEETRFGERSIAPQRALRGGTTMNMGRTEVDCVKLI